MHLRTSPAWSYLKAATLKHSFWLLLSTAPGNRGGRNVGAKAPFSIQCSQRKFLYNVKKQMLIEELRIFKAALASWRLKSLIFIDKHSLTMSKLSIVSIFVTYVDICRSFLFQCSFQLIIFQSKSILPTPIFSLC